MWDPVSRRGRRRQSHQPGETDSGDKYRGANPLCCIAASVFIQSLDRWGINRNSGVANHPTVTMGRYSAASTQGDFCKDGGAASALFRVPLVCEAPLLCVTRYAEDVVTDRVVWRLPSPSTRPHLGAVAPRSSIVFGTGHVRC